MPFPFLKDTSTCGCTTAKLIKHASKTKYRLFQASSPNRLKKQFLLDKAFSICILKIRYMQ